MNKSATEEKRRRGLGVFYTYKQRTLALSSRLTNGTCYVRRSKKRQLYPGSGAAFAGKRGGVGRVAGIDETPARTVLQIAPSIR